MRKILARLTKVRGVRGTLLLSPDGLVIAADLREEISAETVGALTSEVLLNLRNAGERLKLGRTRRFTFTGADGSCAAIPIGETLLVVLVEPEANQALVWVELVNAAPEIEAKMKLGK